MTVEVEIRKGGADVADWEDYSTVHRVEQLEVAHKAHNGESAQFSVTLDDDDGEIGNDASLPGGLTARYASAHAVVVVRETATTPPTVIGRGRYSQKTVHRVDNAMGRSRQVEIGVDDANMHLRGLGFLEPQVRPEETDVERMEWLLATHLQGTPRFTTNLTSRIISDTPITMPEHTYAAGEQPFDVLNDCIRASAKIGFVTVDDELYYAPVTDESYYAGMRISDRENEHNFEGTCATGGSEELLGINASDDGTNAVSDFPAWGGGLEERVEITASSAVPVGGSMLAFVSTNKDGVNAARDRQVYDERGNTWVLDGEAPVSGTSDTMCQVWRCLPTVAIQVGDWIRFATLGTTTGDSESGGRVLGVFGYPDHLSDPVEGANASGFSAAPALGSTQAAPYTVVAASIPDNSAGGAAGDGGWTDLIPFTQLNGAGVHMTGLLAQALEPGSGGAWAGSVDQNRDWSALSIGYTRGIDTDSLPTFPPIDPKSIEIGQELLSGGVLRYGGDGFVTETRDTVKDEYDYWVEAVNEDGVDDATAAADRLAHIIDEQQYESRTYDLAVLLRADQVCLVKPGQMIDIKARAIPDADDAYVTRRIAELRRLWAGPGYYLHQFKLDRPLLAGRRTPGTRDRALVTMPRGGDDILDNANASDGGDSTKYAGEHHVHGTGVQVREVDGAPSEDNVTQIRFSNGAVTVLSDGVVEVDAGGGPSELNDLSDVNTAGQANGNFLQRASGVWVPIGSIPANKVALTDAPGDWTATDLEALAAEIADAIIVAAGSGVPGTSLVVYPAIPMALNSTATEGGVNAGLLVPIVIPAPMRIVALRVHTGTSAVGTNEWGLFDYSVDPTACVKVAGGSGALNGGNPSWSSIAAVGAPVVVPAGTYALILKLAPTNTPTIRITATTSGTGVKRIGTYTWDNTPDLTTTWADSANLPHMYLRGEYAGGTDY
ncbi:MAG TPA: hypothetical protein VEW95_05365 [Candidatus Limnocylindrales bacterium]|nr:hypothetical protein [Candidatus Limnocylindrales bacterium]